MLKNNVSDMQWGDWSFADAPSQSGENLKDHYLILIYGPNLDWDFASLCIQASCGWDHPHWSWNGSRECPTVAPSILAKPEPPGRTGWHGYLREGKLETC